MRPNHQNNNKRMRGRNRNGGKGPNPLSRTYESNGPDVKVRGTAQHVAEKYLQLARDAQASGDPVAGENYLQHAEHYLRLIAAAHEQFRQQNPYYRPFEASGDEEDGEEDGQPYVNGSAQPEARFTPAAMEGEPADAVQPPRFQPRQREFQPREPREFQPRGEGGDAPFYRDAAARGEGREFQNRRDDGRRDDRFSRRGPRQERPERFERPATEPVEPAGALPAFITAPVRQPLSVEAEAPEVEATAPPAFPSSESGDFPVRTRRRRPRLRSAEGSEPEGEDAPVAE